MNGLRCSTCKHWYPPDCFDLDRTNTKRGRQPQCTECRDMWERGENGVYRRMKADLEDEVEHLWTEEVFHSKWVESGGRCFHCGGGLRDWQMSGLTLDRKANAPDKKHYPDDCVLACVACNITRGTMEWHVWRAVIAKWKEEDGGVVDWATRNRRFKRYRIRVTRHRRLPDPQGSLVLA